MEIRQCPICKNSNLTPVYHTDSFPYIGFAVLKEERDKIIQKYPRSHLTSELRIMSCNGCKHAFQSVKPDEDLMQMIYSEFYNYPSAMLSGFSQEREKTFLRFFYDKVIPICEKQNLNRILEIACFDGYILNDLSKKGFTVCGCDPSKGADIAEQFGIKVYKRFFNADDFIMKNEFFDIIIFRHFIEHVQDPVGLLNNAKKVLTKQGLIIFETPNVEYYMGHGSFECFNFQHFQNFSLYSVGETLKRASLNLSDHEVTPENLIVISTRGDKSFSIEGDLWEINVPDFSNNLQKNADSLYYYLKPFIKQKKKIVLWGAGGLCGYFFHLYNVDEKVISYVIDTDERKWEMCFADKDLKIYPPERLLSDAADMIIITSMYSEQIYEQLLEMELKSDVISLHPCVAALASVDSKK